VLTKPDRIPPTEEENWLPFIRGEREDTTLWFCVKCPNTQAIDDGITWEGARRAESEFFSEKVPWSTLRREFKSKLGTEHLTRHLSDKLCDLISERFVHPLACYRSYFFPLQPHSLPHIEREINKLLEKTNKELEDLPPPPSSAPMREIFRLITEFTRAVERQGEGIPGREGLLQQIRSPQDKFRVAIRKTAPCFVPQFRQKPIREEPPIEVSVAPVLYEMSSPQPVSGFFVDSVPVSEPLVDEGPYESSMLAPAAPVYFSPPLISPAIPQAKHRKHKKASIPVEAQPASQAVVSGVRTRPAFLVGEEHYEDIGLNDGKSIFIDDVLETAEWCVPMRMQY